jgi:hypothetical protein
MGPDLCGCRPEADKVLGWLVSSLSFPVVPLSFNLSAHHILDRSLCIRRTELWKR